MEVFEKLNYEFTSGRIPKKEFDILSHFFDQYLHAIKIHQAISPQLQNCLLEYINLTIKEIASPFNFQSYHKREKNPFDYYQLGIDFFTPLILFENSYIIGSEHVKKMRQQLNSGENVILFANHQTEPDPQVINILLQREKVHEVEEMIFVAGDRVITDPLAKPFSRGCNLLCVYSKKHIDHPPELKEFKARYNHKTMKTMSFLLSEGGKWIYVAPSGGRDRPNESGQVDVSPFDPQSIEMFDLISKRCPKPVHFYPLALSTYSLLPPPNCVEQEVGEERRTSCAPVKLSFGPEIDMHTLTDKEDKKEQRIEKSQKIWHMVAGLYRSL
ncbi:MAG: 1-acyl-sn-glycerol-3-phosphate acyltransferase [Chlamydiales bacterium]